MKLIKTLLAIALFIPSLALAQPYTAAQEQDRLISLGMTSELAVELTDYINGDGLISLVLPNNTYLKARNAAGTADLNLLKADASDKTVLNSTALKPIVLQAREDAQRLFTFDASSDTALTQTFGDAGVTAAQVFTLSASTSDADDDSTVFITAGGAADSPTRGASIALSGNEAAGDGVIQIKAGGDAGGAIQLFGRGDTQRKITFDGASDTELSQTFGDGGVTAAQTFGLSASTADADDDSVLYLGGGGGGALTDANRGAAITLRGNEAASGGVLQLYSGTVGATSDINLNLGNSAAQITFKNASGNAMFDMLNSGASTFTSTISSTATSDIGWALVSGANTACNTTCTNACVVGQNTANFALVGCTDATADVCLCAGAS